MLRQVAEDVLVHESRFCQTNTVVVLGQDGVLVIDPGVHVDEFDCLASDLADSSQTVVAGFSTHPHWDHLLWHTGLGSPTRHATARCAATAQDRLAGGVDAVANAAGIPEQVPLDLLGLITGLPAETAQIPWDGPHVRIVEHQAHAPGHAALVIEERGVLIAGDMLSDVLIPMLDLNAADPIEDYLAALRLLEGMTGDLDSLSPAMGRSAGPTRFMHESSRIGRTCSRCGMVMSQPTRGSGHLPSPAGSGCGTCTRGSSDVSAKQASCRMMENQGERQEWRRIRIRLDTWADGLHAPPPSPLDLRRRLASTSRFSTAASRFPCPGSSRVEGWFGNLKNDSREALNRGAFRVMGICKTSLMLTVFAVATNLRLLRGWARRNHSGAELIQMLVETSGSDGQQPVDATANSGNDPPALR